jgi:uncharacterized membrane protein
MGTPFVLLAGLVLATGLAAAEPINQMCPVLTDEAVDPAYTVIWHGQTIGLCCGRCVRQFTADPEKYASHLPPRPTSTPSDPGAAPATDPPVDHGHRPVNATAAAAVLEPALMHAHAPVVSSVPHWLAWLGRFHPVLVHFPIALSLLAACAGLLGRFRASDPFRQTARIAIHGAALLAIPTILLGWFSAASDPHPGLDTVLAWHRWLGTAAGAALIAVAVLVEIGHRRPAATRWVVTGLLGSVLLALIIGVVGHLGGILVFGPDHFTL